MPVYELRKGVSLAAINPIEDLLAELEEQQLMIFEDKPTAQAWIVGYFVSQEEALEVWKRFSHATGTHLDTGRLEIHELPDEDWKDSYKAHFKASKFGRLNWVPVWERDKFVLPAGEEVLWLDPGMAFGTGNHETTRLCCERLARHAELHGSSGRVIDAGCGSGILALSAGKLGFLDISGFDNDPEAIRVSQENAHLNQLNGKVKFYVGDLVSGLAGRQGELVMANIQADVLMKYVDELRNAVAPSGELVLSGILTRELEQVRDRFAENDRSWRIDSRILGEWADLSLTR